MNKIGKIIIILLIFICVLVVAIAYATAGEKYQGKMWIKDYYIAHRGLHDEINMENSMESFKAATEKGYAIELDVHLSSDGQLVVFHDKNLVRMTGKDGALKDFTYEELSQLKLGNTEQKIPLFTEVLDVVKGSVPILIELKNEGKAGNLEEKTLALLKDYKGEYAIQSFSPYSVKWFKDNAPEVLRGQLTGTYEKDAESVNAIEKFALKNLLTNVLSRPHFVASEVKHMDNIMVQTMNKRGIPVVSWVVHSKAEQEGMKNIATVIFENYQP